MFDLFIHKIAVVHLERLEWCHGQPPLRHGILAHKPVERLHEGHGQSALLVDVEAALAPFGAVVGRPLALVILYPLRDVFRQGREDRETENLRIETTADGQHGIPHSFGLDPATLGAGEQDCR